MEEYPEHLRGLSGIEENELIWFPARGYGVAWTREDPDRYGDWYFNHCSEQEKTTMGRCLIHNRFNLVKRYHQKEGLLDVGVGAGGFIDAWVRNHRAKQFGIRGWDIGKPARHLLRAWACFWHLSDGAKIPAMAFWDSLEHIANPELILKRATRWVFISLPVFENVDHVYASKHFKPGEHIWYFTRMGLVRFMEGQGFAAVEESNMETALGRESIGTFVFKRVK